MVRGAAESRGRKNYFSMLKINDFLRSTNFKLWRKIEGYATNKLCSFKFIVSHSVVFQDLAWLSL